MLTNKCQQLSHLVMIKLSLKFLAVPQMETQQTQQPVYAVSFQEQQPEHTPSNQQQDQGNVTFECMQMEMINVAEP